MTKFVWLSTPAGWLSVVQEIAEAAGYYKDGQRVATKEEAKALIRANRTEMIRRCEAKPNERKGRKGQ